MMKKIAFATCNKLPDPTPSDRILADALEERGADVVAAPWNGEFAPFAAANLTVVRSTWDYFDVTDAFSDWIARFAPGRVLNSPDVLRWSMTKAYLFELADKGAPLPPMKRIAPTADEIAGAMDLIGISEAIVKPLSGGTASGLSLVNRRDVPNLENAAAHLNGDAMVMPFLPEIETLGETSFIFIAGEFSHAVLKTPKAGDIRVQEDHGGSSRLIAPPAWSVGEAERILSLCPGGSVYARVDAIVHEDSLTLMEVEMVEPELFFTLSPEAADRLAAVLIDAA